MVDVSEYFSVLALFILFRETIEASIICGVLLQFLNRAKPLLKRTVWLAVAAGVGVSILFGIIFIAIYYTAKDNLFSGTSRAWFKGVICWVAGILITILGFAMLRFLGWEAKWKRRLDEALQKKLLTDAQTAEQQAEAAEGAAIAAEGAAIATEGAAIAAEGDVVAVKAADDAAAPDSPVVADSSADSASEPKVVQTAASASLSDDHVTLSHCEDTGVSSGSVREDTDCAKPEDSSDSGKAPAQQADEAEAAATAAAAGGAPQPLLHCTSSHSIVMTGSPHARPAAATTTPELPYKPAAATTTPELPYDPEAQEPELKRNWWALWPFCRSSTTADGSSPQPKGLVAAEGAAAQQPGADVAQIKAAGTPYEAPYDTGHFAGLAIIEKDGFIADAKTRRKEGDKKWWRFRRAPESAVGGVAAVAAAEGEGGEVQVQAAEGELVQQPDMTPPNKKERWEIFVLVFTTVVREGIESVVFLGGLGNVKLTAIPLSAFVGIVAGVLVGVFLFYSGKQVRHIKWLIIIMAIIIFFIAAGQINIGTDSLMVAGMFGTCSPWYDERPWIMVPAYDWSACCNDLDPVGTEPTDEQNRRRFFALARAIFGYQDKGTPLEIIIYCCYWGVVIIIGFYKWWRGTLFDADFKYNREQKRLKRIAEEEAAAAAAAAEALEAPPAVDGEAAESAAVGVAVGGSGAAEAAQKQSLSDRMKAFARRASSLGRRGEDAAAEASQWGQWRWRK